MKDDVNFIKRCFQLARKAEGLTNPNPMVGCVIVKEGKIVGEGYHHRKGEPHAEILALRQAKEKAHGATLYTNLEPCNHYGNTPPCTQSIIKYGIKKVIYSMLDPNPINNGKGIEALKNSGIKVKGGVLEEEAQKLNRAYIKFVIKGLPYVTVKVAQSLDGKIATSSGESKWITGEESRKEVQKLRNKVDAVMVGINTVLKDNPHLIPHLGDTEKCKPIRRIILDSKLRLPLDSKLFEDIQKFPVIIAAATNIDSRKKDLYKEKGAEVILIGKEKVDIKQLMKKLAQKDILHVLVEGGGEVIASFLEANMMDEIFCFLAPKIIGGREAVTSVEGEGIRGLDKAIKLDDIEVKRIGEDVLIHGYIFG